MSDLTASTSSGNSREPLFTPPSLPKGGGTVSAGGGMLSFGGADGAAGWSLPLPLPSGRGLSPSLALDYSSGGGNSAFGAGWDCSPPAIFRMTRFGVPRYTAADRLAGPDGEEILRDTGSVRRESKLPYAGDNGTVWLATPWVSRSGGREARLEHWVDESTPEAPGFWLQWDADGNLTLYGWSASARLSDPADASRVAGWYAEETVSATGGHLVYRYRTENNDGCSPEELAAHPQVACIYPDAVYVVNVAHSLSLLIPEAAFREEDFLSYMQFDYGERGTDITGLPPVEAGNTWPVRKDCTSFWRYGFNVRTRRLCRDVLLWQRTAIMAGGTDVTPSLISRLHLTHQHSAVASLLLSAQQAAYEQDGTPLTLPPVEFAQREPGCAVPGWEAVPALDGFSPPQWQMADLYGEGLPGLLYQDSGAWWYRAPVRQPDSTPDAVTWEAARVLPLSPGLRGGTLTDLDGDGRPEWLVTGQGINGSFTLSPDGGWGGFIPLEAMPAELLHPDAQLADLTGGGLQDVVMVGPKSVRLYASALSAGWLPAEITAYNGRQPLPVAGGEHRMVAFTDPAGSGQQHLVQITGDGVMCWPSLGHGRFAEPFSIPGFRVENFAASRVFLGDTDGSGTTDILYVERDRVRVFISQSGNRFVEGPPVPAPAGVLLDNSCQLQVTDARGQGTADLMLTVPHMTPRTWLYRFNDGRPWLLSEVCTNTGSRTLFEYRSSAQGWLDEKAALKAAGKPAVSSLPFPVHMLSRVTAVDDISGLVTGSEMRYLRGVWDGLEREFRGFTHLIRTDTLSEMVGTAAERSPPSEVHTWFLSGLEKYDAEVEGAFTGAETDFPVRPLRVTHLNADAQDAPYEPEAAVRRWLLRALKGVPVRTEVYGLDGSVAAEVPYSITRQRWQVRAYDTADAGRPAALVTPVETLTLATERIAQDPVVSQSVVLAQDAFGSTLQSVDIRYPRRPPVTPSPYPATLPEGLEAAARDPQQDDVWLTLSRQTVVNRHQGNDHLTGLVSAARGDVLQLAPADVPLGGFDVECLQSPESPLNDLSRATLASHVRTMWCDAAGTLTDNPQRPPLVAYTETTMLDEASLTPLKAVLTEAELKDLLKKGGYHQVTLPEDGMPVYAGRHNFSRHAGAPGFYSLTAVRDSELTGETQLTWDKHWLAVTAVQDAAGLRTAFEYDWRFLAPVRMTDPNDNVHEAISDALGRVVQSRFYGTEEGVMTGYRSGRAFAVPDTVEGMLALEKGSVPVATAHRVEVDSWMPFARDALGDLLPERTGELAFRRWQAESGLPVDITEGRVPPHIISMQTDRYDGDPEQQVRLSITHSDGAGRLLQTSVLNPPGEAFVRTPEGALETGKDGKAVTTQAAVRWAVTGRTEYDNKGQPVRTWLPFYLNDWRPVYSDAGRDGIYADTQVYDAMGRVFKVITAAGWERRTQYFPWFTVSEDENDTAADVQARQNAH
ncbi:SpvB/TcaC N-terminal domain-containing protein [Enterobacter sp. 22466]|uniref:SpvB/TcaC N-terminal domain-containing protein n=1 Tax=Enterobacter sp. 22466 TaxID=3453924 RepID=UPI003F8417DB